MSLLSRRTFLRTGALLGATFINLPRLSAQDNGTEVESILDLLVTAETLNCTHYYIALTDSGVQLTPHERSSAIATLDADLMHLELLQSLGGRSIAAEFFMPRNVYRNRDSFAPVTEDLKMAVLAAYLAANRSLAESGEVLIGATMAQIAAVEAVHLALTRQLSDKLPNDVGLAPALYQNPLEVKPILQPFIEGGTGFVGPNAFPGADVIRKLVGNAGVRAVAAFTDTQK